MSRSPFSKAVKLAKWCRRRLTRQRPSSPIPNLGASGLRIPGSLPSESNPETPAETPPQVSLTNTATAPGSLKPNALSTMHIPTLALIEETSKPVAHAPVPQFNPPDSASLISGTSVLPERYFCPAKPSLLGCIKEPEGKPSCGGGYSDVWRCKIRFSTPTAAHPTEVAVKVLRSVWLTNRNGAEANARLLQRFQQEAITWLGLPDHPNVVPLIGWTLTPNLSFISPWYRQGNLRDHLNKFSRIQQLNVLLGIAKGLQYLHSRSPPVVHGDLKPENVLLSDQGEPLLADFGLSTILGEERMYTSSHRVGGSAPWMAPECMVGVPRSCQSDTYSFGSLAFMVMTGEPPHDGLTDCQITLKVCDAISPKDPVEDWNRYPQLQGPIECLLRNCWSRSPEARPSMSVIVERLGALLEAHETQIPPSLQWTVN